MRPLIIFIDNSRDFVFLVNSLTLIPDLSFCLEEASQHNGCRGRSSMTFTTFIRDTFKSFLLNNGLHISRTTEPKLLTQFFDAIKPISTNHSLIRIGGESDGGYLIPNDLDGITACFSPGVSDVADFEYDLASKGIQCFLADYSVDAPPIHNKLFHFEKKFLGPIEDSIHTTLESWVTRNAPDQKNLILQMDIEGSEYGVIINTSRETLRKFRIMVIEFHRLDSLMVWPGFTLIDLAFKKLLEDFDVVHIHPNNSAKPVSYGKYEVPPYLEFTFLRKDRTSIRQPTLTFPHELDRKNVSHNDDFPLPKCWYAQTASDPT